MGSRSAELYDNSTHISVCLSQICGKYYANEQNLDQLLLKDMAEVGRGIDPE